jgi:hypothetical protein
MGVPQRVKGVTAPGDSLHMLRRVSGYRDGGHAAPRRRRTSASGDCGDQRTQIGQQLIRGGVALG